MLELENIVRKNQYFQIAPDWMKVKWRNQAALNWFVKHNHSQLEALGAVARIGNEVFILPAKMPHAAAAIYGLSEHFIIDAGVTRAAAVAA